MLLQVAVVCGIARSKHVAPRADDVSWGHGTKNVAEVLMTVQPGVEALPPPIVVFFRICVVFGSSTTRLDHALHAFS